MLVLAISHGTHPHGILSEGLAEGRTGERGDQARLEFQDVPDPRHRQGKKKKAYRPSKHFKSKENELSGS